MSTRHQLLKIATAHKLAERIVHQAWASTVPAKVPATRARGSRKYANAVALPWLNDWARTAVAPRAGGAVGQWLPRLGQRAWPGTTQSLAQGLGHVGQGKAFTPRYSLTPAEYNARLYPHLNTSGPEIPRNAWDMWMPPQPNNTTVESTVHVTGGANPGTPILPPGRPKPAERPKESRRARNRRILDLARGIEKSDPGAATTFGDSVQGVTGVPRAIRRDKFADMPDTFLSYITKAETELGDAPVDEVLRFLRTQDEIVGSAKNYRRALNFNKWRKLRNWVAGLSAPVGGAIMYKQERDKRTGDDTRTDSGNVYLKITD